MLCLDLVDEVDEHALHLVPHVVEVGRTQVGIVVDEALQLSPLHLAAPLMEQTALLPVRVTVLADESRLAAVWIGTDRVA